MISCNNRLKTALVAIATAGVAAVAPSMAQSPDDEVQARRRLESGRSFMRDRNYGEALKDFQVVLEQFPKSSVADDALLDIAVYQLEVQRDPGAAEGRAKELLEKYPTSDSAAMALVLQGRVALVTGRSPERLNEAIASFDRVPRLYPGSPAIPASMYFAGEAARLGGRRAEAIERFTRLTTQFPNSAWTANALLGAAVSLTRAGQPLRAIEHLQRVRNRFPRTPEAATAVDWNTVLYRLYLRAPAQPAYQFSGRTIPAAPGKLRDVADIAVDAENTVLVASKTGVIGYGPKGNQTASVPAPEPRSLAFDRLGRILTVHEIGVRLEGRTPLTMTLPVIEGRVPQMKAAAAVVTAIGNFLVADEEQKTIFRFDADGRHLGPFARQIEARRMAINDLDEVAVLHGNSKSVTIFGGDGRIIKQIAERGANYQLRNPVGVAFDAFGHLYVQDRAAVLVFAPEGARLLTTFTVPEKAPGAMTNSEAVALDRAGRLYVFDSRSDSVRVYR